MAAGGFASSVGDGPLAPRELVQLAEELFTAYEPAKLTVDSHTEAFFATKKHVCEGDKVFAEQVLYGCTRYKKLLDAFITALYYHESANLMRTDRIMYTVYAYLALLRLDDLTFPQFRRLIFSNDPQKMLCFMQFTFDPEILRELCRDEWLKIYDTDYVDALIQQITTHESEVDEVISKLDQKVTLAKQKEDEEAAAWQKSGFSMGTVPAPFNLTISKPRPLPPVEEPPPPLKARPAPPRRTGPTAEEKAIQASLEESRRRRADAMADVKPFRLRVLERPSNLEQVRAEQEERRRQEETYEPAPPRPVPAPPAADVKYNTAAILREEYLYRQRAEKEAKALKNVEEALRDGAGDYEIWRIDQKAAEDAARAIEADRKREEARAAEEASRRAREAATERNVLVADQQREEAKLALELLKEQREREKELNLQKVDKVTEDRALARAAKEKSALDRKAQAEEISKESADLIARRALEVEEERRRKAELVKQIREMQAAAAAARGEKSQAELAAQPSGLGSAVDEMSIQELKERLLAVTEDRRREEEDRRSRILADRSAKDESILAKAARLQRMREQNKQTALVRKARQAAAQAAATKATQARVEAGAEGALGRLQEKRAKKAAEDARFADELAAVQAKVGALASGVEKLQAAQNKGIRDAAERMARETQKKNAQEGAMRVLISAQGHRDRSPLRATGAGKKVGHKGPPEAAGIHSGSPGPAGEALIGEEQPPDAEAAAAADAAAAAGPREGSAASGVGSAAGGGERPKRPTGTPQVPVPV